MFGRKSSKTTPEEAYVKESGKGHPTPTRKQAEADARARAKASATGVDPRSSGRQQRLAENRAARDAASRGDERFLLARDKGPIRRFLRDLVDSRIHVAELLLPLLVLYMVLYFLQFQQLASAVWFTTIVFVVGDIGWLFFQTRRELRRRFPGQSHRGAFNYVAMRAIQMRFTRRPKPQVKLGDTLGDNYK